MDTQSLTFKEELLDTTKRRTYFNADGEEIGVIAFVEEITAEITIEGIRIEPDHQRKGFGMKILKLLLDEFQKPLRPRRVDRNHLSEARGDGPGKAYSFWQKAAKTYGEKNILSPRS